MTDVRYTDPALVTNVRATDTVPRKGQTVSGYGGQIPTSHLIEYGKRWHRVYVMCWSNAATAYILVRGERLILDTDTEYRLKKGTDT